MAADHEKEEDEGWTRGLMQDFQAAGQKYRSINLMPNLSSGSFLAWVQNSDIGYYSFWTSYWRTVTAFRFFIFLDL